MSIKTIKYFSTIIVAIVGGSCRMVAVELLHAISVDTRRKIRAAKGSITPQVSGRIVELNIKDNQLVNAGNITLHNR